MKSLERCTCCGQRYDREDLTYFNNYLLCPSCLSEESCICDHCGNRIWIADNEGNDTLILCPSCYENNYTHCDHCGRLIALSDAHYLDDEDEPYCESCYNLHQSDYIHEYNYKPVPVFYGEGPRYFGVELELDEGGERDSNAKRLIQLVNKKQEYLYCKHDGSLSDGFELVTHPISLSFHLNHMPWAQLTHRAVELGYLSHKCDTCGLHIHISRNAFGDTIDEQDNTIARVLYFVEKHWNELLIFSRRTQRQLDRWAARYGYKDQPSEMMEHVKKGYASRYTCVNLTNDSTIEFRIFRGTLKYNTLIATLQMVNHICNVALSMSDKELKTLSWSTFMAYITEPELIQYLKERRLYLNEPVNSEEEL